MSSRGRSAEGYKSDPKGFFETQPTVTRAGMTLWNIEPGMTILEPGCGNGAIARVLRRQYGRDIKIVGIEIDKARAKKALSAKITIPASCQNAAWHGVPSLVFDDVIHEDCFRVNAPELAARGLTKIDRIITNPSFSIWKEVAEHSFTLCDFTSLLIPWNTCASIDRVDWWLQHPARCRVISPRPSFAASVKCVYTNAKAASAAGVSPCTFQEMIALSAKPKRECPICGEKTTVVRSDSNEYSWTTWAPGILSNSWDPILQPDPHPDDIEYSTATSRRTRKAKDGRSRNASRVVPDQPQP